MVYFHELACSADPELLAAMSRFPDPTVDQHCIEEVFKDVAMKLADDAPSVSSRTLHRRVAAGFEIASRLPKECHQSICDKVCGMIAKVVDARAAGAAGAAGTVRFPVKAYAALRSIADIPEVPPFYVLLSENRDLLHCVAELDKCLPDAAVDTKTNL